jgi:hypothetical protein
MNCRRKMVQPPQIPKNDAYPILYERHEAYGPICYHQFKDLRLHFS